MVQIPTRARSLADRLGRLSPRRVAVGVLLFHALWMGAYFAAGHEVRDFVKIGPNYVTRSHASSVIRFDPRYDYPKNHLAGQEGNGFDGQTVYYIALDPRLARHYIDDPGYRYQRILYPMAARALALARPAAVPWAMLLINWLAVGVGVLALGAWLRRRGSPPWLAGLYGLFPGLLVALQRDLTEPLAYGLVAVAVYLFDFGGRRGVLAAGVAFGLAGLARETTLLFAIPFGLSLLTTRPRATPARGPHARAGQATAFAALALLPAALWIGWEWSWLGLPGAPGRDISLVPFSGAFDATFALSRQPVEALFVVVPALLCAGVAVFELRRGIVGWVERVCLLANVLFIVVLASGELWISYTSIGRVSTAIVLAALLCVPEAHPRPARARAALALAALLWLVVLPAIMVYGFAEVSVS